MSDEDDGSDPFEEFEEAASDREGDPFDNLASGEERPPSSPEEPTDEPIPGDAGTADGADIDRSEGPGHTNVGRDETDRSSREPPFSDFEPRDGDPFEGFDDPFDEVDVEELDPDEVWQRLTSAQSRGSVGDPDERIYTEVSKHSFCEQCEHFSSPPDIHCTHEGTQIVEFLDMDTVRVVDCPVVAERERLQSGHGKD